MDKDLTENRVLEMALPDGIQAPAISDGVPIVRVIDRVDAKTVLLSWSDALSGRYGEQTWKMSDAKRSGRCVLSGRWIVRGEPVYRPQARPRPRNAEAMISAASLEALARCESPTFL
ncbi:DUF3331 domain-containing protein [Paraburkholderia sp.]|uniref:DUF3331 domain-containing protein n=1 Tax=Paraburkholderia sp. TaxID=1926495 RepID=UPI0039E48039